MGIVYTTGSGIYLLTSDAATPEKLTTPGYTSLVTPQLTSDGHLLYAGNGLYLADLSQIEATPLQIVSIDTTRQVIASMAISADGQQVFWTVEPHNGSGAITLYEATLTASGASSPMALYSQPAGACPCYAIFGLGPASATGVPTLLLTDDLGTPADQGTGLWVFDQAHHQIGQELLSEKEGQIPLALSPNRTQLAYAPTTGEVPEPTDGSVPQQVGSQPYGNSMSVAGWTANISNPVTIVPSQTNIHTFSTYHWITTPIFSPDGKSIAYIQFSSDDNGPYDRHSTLYTAATNGSGAPAVIVNFTVRLVELGGWLDSHTLLLYADGGIYALDTRSAAISLLAVVTRYSHIIGLVPLSEGAAGGPNCHPQRIC
jgi:hypothetical protein